MSKSYFDLRGGLLVGRDLLSEEKGGASAVLCLYRGAVSKESRRKHAHLISPGTMGLWTVGP